MDTNVLSVVSNGCAGAGGGPLTDEIGVLQLWFEETLCEGMQGSVARVYIQMPGPGLRPANPDYFTRADTADAIYDSSRAG